jgi:hypothetical protein
MGLRKQRPTVARLQSAVQRYRGRGIVLARTALILVRRVDSPRETWLRLCLVLAGLPMPECRLIVGDNQGPIGRVDLVFLPYKLIIAHEGDQHRTDRHQCGGWAGTARSVRKMTLLPLARNAQFATSVLRVVIQTKYAIDAALCPCLVVAVVAEGKTEHGNRRRRLTCDPRTDDWDAELGAH